MKKYLSVYEKIKNEILSGVYKAGDKIPSKRVMVDITGFSEITVMNAYSLLESEGYIEARERSGYFVCEIDVIVKSAPHKPFEMLPIEVEPIGDEFEYSLWFKTVRKVISEKDKELFIKSPTEGCAVLRNAISDYLLRYRGMVAPPERIIIGSGSEQLYETAVKILGKDKVYGIEDPSYKQIEKVYLETGVKIKKLKMGEEGIETGELESSGVKVLHVTPFSSFPSGVTATVKKRYEYLNYARKNNGYIIEDDFASEFFIPGNPIQSLYGLDGGERVVYVNTFSKSLSPAMRIGYMIIPESLIYIYKEKTDGFSCSVPVLDQYVLSEFISSGSFERHLSRVRRKMNKKVAQK
ncbi:MAG: PLP-dependent aminotransferase family protein [Clostridia bacterium]|nr:PLP-dependent aminotransferase family protein [Clostridia bacterium]